MFHRHIAQAKRIFYCKAYVRIDMIIYDGVPYALKLNALYLLTKISSIPKVKLRQV